MAHTFFWHDYETFGAQPRYDRPAQFAGIRTDDQLNEIGEPVMWYCQPANDYLPDPQSCLITGITPRRALEEGVPEHEFAALIEAELAQAGTVGVGYNTIRFDDEITRFMFWRNLIDPYAREWQNGCGRWDLLDVVRMVYALRPEGIQWPTKEDGTPSFRLEDLARANGLLHEQAHDALSDVRATIALARLIREKQPRLFDFAFGLHKKDGALREMGLPATQEHARPFLHVTGMISPARGCLGVMWPLATHPTNKNEVICWDLAADPAELSGISIEELRLRLFTRQAELPEGVTRLPIKSIHVNKSPMVVGSLKTLSPAMAEKWGVDMELAMQHAAIARDLPDMSAQWKAVFTREAGEPLDADQDLYGGFVGNEDRRRLERIKRLSPQELALDKTGFDDARLTELAWRYRARNFPQTLDAGELQRWEQHRAACLIEGQGGARTAEQMFTMIDALSESVDERGEEILGDLYDYGSNLVPES
ncbi:MULTISPECIES: exodeoxyribonuclease I [Comamonas]|uniref:exodeoxyribonuclease I n=1 Tax=Comamonas TaxID=283 RepID=UPI00050FD0BD|nr:MULTISPECIES: exodeoxyribonuclease I [Comamonas]KGG83554.1 exonuclease I [Comamonas thiooxydans]KGG96250.1 exonuclease I [Comamonas thiooxydans]KGH02684.1 exonuclease I [Comamonas thiooxydans]KGH07715.1 exonuclease I [Comamonas thiooxydans]TZG09342.1 exodeoxyribonuclease I [Comamonas thiooxydans]